MARKWGHGIHSGLIARSVGFLLLITAGLLGFPGPADAQVNDTSTTVLTASSGSVVPGETVTLTASVTNDNDNFIPTGTVTFTDLTSGATLGSDFRIGGAEPLVFTLNVSALAVGNHSIRASFSGGNYVAAGAIFHAVAGSDSNILTVSVGAPADSVKLRAMQVAASALEGQASAQAVSGAIDTAIGEAFSDNGAFASQTGTGVRFNFAAESERGASKARVGGAFDALASASRDPVYKSPVRTFPKEWLAWADVRGSGWRTDVSAGDIRGEQINALAGLTRRLTPNMLIGAFGGYESFDYTSQMLAGRLKGDGWTAGGYFGWRIMPGVRFDAAISRSGIGYDVSAGTAAGNFSGQRWLASGGVTGTTRVSSFVIEPSARIYALWEKQDAYIDSLGTAQAQRNFSSGRASAGAKASYPVAWIAGVTVSPYVGAYADYYFSKDDAAAVLLPAQLIDGWSARIVSGVAVSAHGGAAFSAGGELGGIGADHALWSLHARASMPF